MIILPEHKAVYVSCARTGTHTMFTVLKQRYAGYHFEPWDDYHRTVIPTPYQGWYTFRTVRNPYPRAVSIWRAMQQERKYRMAGKSFAEFARWLAVGPRGAFRISHPQHVWHFGNEYHETLKIEDIDEEAKRLPFWNGPDHLDVFPNTTQGKPWLDEYNGQRAHDIETWAGPEFELYGYDKLT